jgi:co-chaperonin GroES (HSP10)
MSVSLRMVGSRVLLKPVPVTPPSDLIELTDKRWNFVGEVVAVGRPCCPSCGASIPADVEVGDWVYVPATKGHEIVIEGQTYWVLAYDDVRGVLVE